MSRHLHTPECNRLVPVQNEFRPSHGPLVSAPWVLTVPLWVAEEAFAVYEARYHGQTLERLNQRAGFGSRELLDFLAGGSGDGDVLERRKKIIDHYGGHVPQSERL